jgi:hypothetical protein
MIKPPHRRRIITRFGPVSGVALLALLAAIVKIVMMGMASR